MSEAIQPSGQTQTSVFTGNGNEFLYGELAGIAVGVMLTHVFVTYVAPWIVDREERQREAQRSYYSRQ